MTNREFVIWLSGFFELADDNALTKHQLVMVNNHLNLAEAVEGGLGEFNLELRDIIRSEMHACKDLDKEDHIAPEISDLLKDKVCAKIKEF